MSNRDQVSGDGKVSGGRWQVTYRSQVTNMWQVTDYNQLSVDSQVIARWQVTAYSQVTGEGR